MASLSWLCSEGKLDQVRAALARGADVNGQSGGLNQTVLMWAIMNEHNSIVRLLLEQPTVDLNATDSFEQTALHHAVYENNVEGVQLLLADPRLNTANQKDEDGSAPTMLALRRNSLDVLRELVAHPSVDLDTRDEDGLTLEEVARLAIASAMVR